MIINKEFRMGGRLFSDLVHHIAHMVNNKKLSLLTYNETLRYKDHAGLNHSWKFFMILRLVVKCEKEFPFVLKTEIAKVGTLFISIA